MRAFPFSHFADSQAAHDARDVIRRIKGTDHDAYFVGGALRDILLGNPPKDVDVATDASLDEVLALFPRAEVVGRAYGACLVRHGHSTVEVVSFRQDGPYADGRHPSWVRPASREQDARRRDFTINALYYDPERELLIDDVDGEADLAAKRIRAIGEPRLRFSEDRLRLFRAVRFAARLGFAIETDTYAALCELAPESADLAPERVENELTRLLLDPNAADGLRLLTDSGLLDIWLPEVAALRGLDQGARHHPEGDAFTHTVLAVQAIAPRTPERVWAALLHDIGKRPTAAMRKGEPFFPNHAGVGAKMAETIAARLRFSKTRTFAVSDLVARHMAPLHYAAMRLETRRKLFLLPDFPAHLDLWRADRAARLAPVAPMEAIAADYADFCAKPELLHPLLGGADLVNSGLAPGPAIGALLREIRKRQLAGTLTTREEALAFAARRRKRE